MVLKCVRIVTRFPCIQIIWQLLFQNKYWFQFFHCPDPSTLVRYPDNASLTTSQTDHNEPFNHLYLSKNVGTIKMWTRSGHGTHVGTWYKQGSWQQAVRRMKERQLFIQLICNMELMNKNTALMNICIETENQMRGVQLEGTNNSHTHAVPIHFTALSVSAIRRANSVPDACQLPSNHPSHPWQRY